MVLGGFLKGQTLGKLTGCEGDFTQLVWPFRETFLLQKSAVQNILSDCENHLPSYWNDNESPVASTIKNIAYVNFTLYLP